MILRQPKYKSQERPDLDHQFTECVQMMTHHGGWPMTLFLTTEAVPFYAGTYFPPEDRYNMPGFPRVLISLAEAFRERPEDIQQTAASVLSELNRSAATRESDEVLSTELWSLLPGTIKLRRDDVGWRAPKFPPAMTRLSAHTFSRQHAQLSRLFDIHVKMARSLYASWGGFHRYSPMLAGLFRLRKTWFTTPRASAALSSITM